MSTANSGLVEVYVMKKLYKEKMKKMEDEMKSSAQEKEDGRFEESGNGCFSLFKLKKVHPKIASAVS